MQADSGSTSSPGRSAACNVHVQGQNEEAKIWQEPGIELAQHTGLSRREIGEALRLVQEHENDIRRAWQQHFAG